MASFDIIDAAGHSYQLAWRERDYLYRLALAPVFLKFVILSALLLLDVERNFLWQAVLMLPAFLVEGWFIAHVIRLVFFGERWLPLLGYQNEEKPVNNAARLRGIKSCAVSYALIKFLLSGSLEFAARTGVSEIEPGQEMQDADILFMLVLLFTMIYGFRFIWIYVLLAVNAAKKEIIRIFSSFGISFYLIGAWLLCFIPPLLIMVGLTGIVLGEHAFDDSLPFTTKILVVLLQSVFDTLITLLTTIAVAFGFHAVLTGKGENNDG